MSAHNPRCAIFQDPPSLRDARDCNCGAIPALRPSCSLEEAIMEIERRKQTLPYNVDTVVRIDELDHVLEILRDVRP